MGTFVQGAGRFIDTKRGEVGGKEGRKQERGGVSAPNIYIPPVRVGPRTYGGKSEWKNKRHAIFFVAVAEQDLL